MRLAYNSFSLIRYLSFIHQNVASAVSIAIAIDEKLREVVFDDEDDDMTNKFRATTANATNCYLHLPATATAREGGQCMILSDHGP